MPRNPTKPNLALRHLLEQAACTQDDFAGHLNAVCRENGRPSELDRRSVAHWLAGRRPRPPLPELAAEALSRVLGRPVSVAETGLAAPHGVRAPAAAAVTVLDDLRLLGDPGSGRRGAAAFSLNALRHAGWPESAAGPARPIGEPGPSRLDEGAVAGAEHTVRVFSDADTAYGGGRARVALASILAHDVGPRLAAPGPARLATRMFQAAAQLAYLCAFMCFDERRDGLAESYYLAAIDLARHSANTGAYAITLRALSVQAHTLRHPREALHLAEAAEAAGNRALPAANRAFLYGQLAVARAADGDRQRATAALRAAEQHLDRATSATPAPPGVAASTGRYHPASLAHQESEVRALLGDPAGAIRALTSSLHHRPDAERRSRALTTARLAELLLGAGHLDRAAEAWHRFLDDYPYLASARADAALRTLVSRVRPLAAHPSARHLLARALGLRSVTAAGSSHR